MQPLLYWIEFMANFKRYLGIDYSGAETIDASLKGLRVYNATRATDPQEVLPPPSPRKYWTRRGLAEWLVEELRTGPATLVAIDHGFSFPLRYFESFHVLPNWSTFLDDFQRHWPTDLPNVYVDFVRDGIRGDAEARQGVARWRRLTEVRCGAKSVFHFDVPGSVAKSTHAGLPWLRYLRQELGSDLHFWPFDGWAPPSGRSVIAEGYPALLTASIPREGRDVHQHDAYCLARWLRDMDTTDRLQDYFSPELSPAQRNIAGIEGWILGQL
jgi:hypothetical protein